MSDTTPRTPEDSTVDDAGPVSLATDVIAPMSDDTDDDLASLLAKREHARPNRATWALLTLLVLAVGFVGGAFVSSRWGSSATSSAGTMPDFAAMAAGGGFPGTEAGTDASGAAATGTGAGGFGGGMTFGTVKLVDGSTLYLTDSSGNTVTVKVPDSATVTSQQTVTLADLAAGDTVMVRGATADDGTVTAESVSEGSLPQGAAPAGAGSVPTASQPTTTQGDN